MLCSRFLSGVVALLALATTVDAGERQAPGTSSPASSVEASSNRIEVSLPASGVEAAVLAAAIDQSDIDSLDSAGAADPPEPPGSGGCDLPVAAGCGPQATGCSEMYFSALLGTSIINGDSGGFNTEGLFANTGSGSDPELSLGGALGVALPRSFGTLRLEAEGRWRNDLDIRTNSFTPVSPPFAYDVQVSDSWSTLGNFWFDIPVDDCREVYFGGGLGMAGHKLSVFDGVVQGAGSGTDFAWQIGAGVNYHVTDRVTLDFGYRYADLGDADIALATVPFNTAAGNYTLDVESHDIMLTVRINGWPLAR